MKQAESKYIDREDVRKMYNFYNRVHYKQSDKNQRMKVLMKNLELMLKNIVTEKKILAPEARDEFFNMVLDFLQKSKRENYPLSYSLVNLYKKAKTASPKKSLVDRRQEQARSMPQAILKEKEPKRNFWIALKDKISEKKNMVLKMTQYAMATAFAAFSLGNCISIKPVQSKRNIVAKEQSTKVQRQIFAQKLISKNQQSDMLKQVKDSFMVPYQAEIFQGIKENEANYKQLVQDLVKQFQENIATLQNAATNRRQFYKSQEILLRKYGKSPYITPQSSCESMSYTTFLSVLDKHKEANNNVVNACKDLLLSVPNPHACYSNKKTFNGQYSKNLRQDLRQELKQNPYGIYMVWIKRDEANLHRMTIIGTGDNKAYLMAYNNNRMVEMNAETLEKVTAQGGYFCNLGEIIKNKANELVSESKRPEPSQLDKTYFAFLLQQKNIRRS